MGSRRAVAAQRECEDEGACNRADCPEETSLVRPMASPLALMLQPLPRGEHPWFELGWSRHRRILTYELTPRLAECSGVTADGARRVVCG
jgi:hypothetical protein